MKKSKLRSIEGYVVGIIAFSDEKIGDNYLPRPYNSKEALEKNLWDVIGRYGLGHQREDTEVRNLSARYPYFREVWHEKLINSTDKREINDIYTVVIRAINKYSGLLTREIKQAWKESAECWAKNHDSYCNIKGFHTCKESSKILREKLAKFDAKFPFSVNNGDWAKEWARKVLRDCLLTEIEKADKWESKDNRRDDNAIEIDEHESKFKVILDNLQNAKFFQNKKGKWKVEAVGQEIEHTITSFRDWMKQIINSEYLKEKWLPVGQKKADLLRKLEEVVESGTKEVENTSQSTLTDNDTSDTNNGKVSENENNETSDNTSDDYSEVSSIFDEYEETDNSSDNSFDNNDKQKLDNQKEDPKLIETWREQNISTITKHLNKEPVVKEEDLEVENHNWLGQIKASDSWKEINDISQRVWGDIIRKRKIKQQNIDLDAILEETVDARNFSEHFQTAQRSLGEAELQVKAERAKKKLIENDPELYFDTFNQWVEKEEKKLETELETISELEYNEEEKQFLAGQITDRQKQEQIAQQIEVKLDVKKKYWNIMKWLKEKAKWIETKAKLMLKKKNKVGFEKAAKQIKQELKNTENNSNLHIRQAFKHAENQAKELLRKLENLANETTNHTSDKNKSPIGWVLGVGAVLLTAMLMTTLIIRRRKKKMSK